MKSATSAPPSAAASVAMTQAEPQVRHDIELREPEGIGADAEECAVPERGQPGMAEHEIERQRIDREDQDLDAQILVEPDALDPQRHVANSSQLASMAAVKVARCGPRPSQASRMLFLPNSPRARNVTTAISSRYIDSIDHSDA